ARRDGVVLADSWAYSDSATDVPMLEAVGHPVAVNPDRALRRIAVDRGWETRRFKRLGLPATQEAATQEAATQEAVTQEAVTQEAVTADGPRGRRWRVPALAAVAAASGGVTAWHYLHRPPAPAH
ncbi:MAG: hypothetical protein M3Y36_06215, partial [Actinomycetota bacterium]|nr:hypothetical protein [Actinomycetota bacterium]